MQLRARSYENGEPICITVNGERIASIEPAWPSGDVDAWPYVAPGLFDLQINGHGGTWFSSPDLTAAKVIETLEPHFRYGITRLCPTLVTNSFEALSTSFAAICEACESNRWVEDMVPGCHLEGPFISREEGPRGAHPLEHVRPADFSEFEQLQKISGDRIRLVTLAPEVDGGIDFIERAVAAGVVVALGHTAAEPEQITAAVDAGARLSTHLGNGAHGTIRRHPNYIWQQLGDCRLMASIITDGHHLPASVIRSIIDAKSPHNIIITSDAAGLAGCPPGIYTEGNMEVELLDDGRIVIAGQRQLLAGSSRETFTCVAHAMTAAGVGLTEAMDMAGRNPARLLGCEEIRLQRGSRADLILFDPPLAENGLRLLATIAAGKTRFGRLPLP
jgi:N-acetylglucosamine-6-phosphate deacetylase